MTAVIARAAIVPVFAQPTLRCEQASQLVLGETAAVLETTADWRRVRTDLDGYAGWVHAGYCVEVDDAGAEAWRHEATGWSLGAVVRLGEGRAVRLPLRARVALEREVVRLPDGRRGQVAEGALTRAAEAGCGAPVPLDDVRPGDLLFFRDDAGPRVTHVAFAGEADTLVHSTIAVGGMVQEPWLPGSRAASLRERLVAVRRLEER
jgi:dipeptidyl peptidase-like protein